MTRAERVLRRVAFGWMAMIGLLGGLFVAGETFDDPGGLAAVGLVCSWLVPLVALALFALRGGEKAGPVFSAATVVVAVFTITDAAFGIVPRDDWGPVAAIAVFGLGVSLAFLGLRHASLAGSLLLLLAAAQVAAGLAEAVDHEGPRNLLGGSSGVVIVPLAVGGVLFLLAGRRSGAVPAGRSPRHTPVAR